MSNKVFFKKFTGIQCACGGFMVFQGKDKFGAFVGCDTCGATLYKCDLKEKN